VNTSIPPTQAAHKISNRQHLIEEAKKAYAAKLVADKAGGPEAGKPIFSSCRQAPVWSGMMAVGAPLSHWRDVHRCLNRPASELASDSEHS